MINALLEKLLSPIKISKIAAKPSKTNSLSIKKHLVIQTIYSSANSTSTVSLNNNKTVDNKPTSTLPTRPDKTLLDKQKEILLNNNTFNYSLIEQVTLDRNTFLIGLTRHAQTIMRGIFMFPDIIRYTSEWTTMKQKASSLNTGIAIFQPLQEVSCLRLKQEETDCFCYLVDHRAISRTRWLWHSSIHNASNPLQHTGSQ